jgi:outer membrane protein OmpA-like peptidoglycan-associated protein
MTVPTRTELHAEVERLFRPQHPAAPQKLDPKDPKQAEFVKAWIAIRDDVLNEWTNKVFFEHFPNAGKLDPTDPGDQELIGYWRDIRDQIRDDKEPRHNWDAGRGTARTEYRDSDSTVTETYRPSGKVEFRGDLHSSDNRDRVLHPSEGVGYAFNKSETDLEMLRKRIESLPADIQEALKRGDDKARVTIVATASLPGSEAGNQVLSEARGQDMAKAMRDLGVKTAIDWTAVGEGPAAEVDTPDVDNPASRVATFAVEITKPAPPPDPTETPSPADAERPEFEVPKTKAEAESEAIDKILGDIKPSFKLRKMIESAVKMQWLAAASGYAGAKAKEAKEGARSGFAKGVVYGADGREWEQLKEDFWRYEPGRNDADQNIAIAAQREFNNGLAEGFKRGRDLSARDREWLWREIGSPLSDGGDSSSWDRAQRIDKYTKASTAFRRRFFTD